MADAVVVIIEGEADTLLGVSRPDDATDFGLPGGSIDPGETPELAAIREVKEETGLEVQVRRVHSEPYHGHVVFVFVATHVSGLLHESNEGVVRWVKWADVKRGRYGDFNAQLERFDSRR